MLMTGHVICFSGRIASGKTSLSKDVASSLNCPWISFGDFVRKTAKEKGQNSEDRKVLQILGEELVSKNLDYFCRSVLNQTDWGNSKDLVVDGIRHLEVYAKIKEIVQPKKAILVYIDADNEIQEERVLSREKDDEVRKLKLYEEHSTEVQIKDIARLADYVLNARKEVDKLRDELLNKILGINLCD